MKITHLALACVVAAAGTAALAQNEAPTNSRAANAQPSQSASELGQKAKRGMHNLGDKTKSAWNKLKGKAHDAEARNDARDEHDTRAMGAGKSRDRTASSDVDMNGSRQQRMDDAYANYRTKQPQ